MNKILVLASTLVLIGVAGDGRAQNSTPLQLSVSGIFPGNKTENLPPRLLFKLTNNYVRPLNVGVAEVSAGFCTQISQITGLGVVPQEDVLRTQIRSLPGNMVRGARIIQSGTSLSGAVTFNCNPKLFQGMEVSSVTMSLVVGDAQLGVMLSVTADNVPIITSQ